MVFCVKREVERPVGSSRLRTQLKIEGGYSDFNFPFSDF